MPAPDERLLQLADAYGIDTEARTFPGVSQSMKHVMAALGADPRPGRVQLQLHDRDRARWVNVLPEVVVKRAGWAPDVPVRLQADLTFDARLHLESGEEWPLRPSPAVDLRVRMDGVNMAQRAIELPADVPLGYHRIEVETSDGHTYQTPVIVTPERLDQVAALGPERRWGMRTPLARVRSEHSWGIADLTDAVELGSWAATWGADFIHLGVLGAEPQPSSRRFLDPSLIRVEEIPELGYLSAAEFQLIEWHADDARRRNSDPALDPTAALRAKRAALKTVFAMPRRYARAQAFADFCAAGGEELDAFALWSAIRVQHGTDRTSWPAGLADVSSAETAEFAKTHAIEIAFEKWLQWIADDQLYRARRDLQDVGMGLGITHTLAAAEHPDGFETWAHPSRYAADVVIARATDGGTKADDTDGDDAASRNCDRDGDRRAALTPDAVEADGFRHWRELVRAACDHGGAVRLERPSMLFQQRWRAADESEIPESEREDVIVRFNAEALIGIVILEAARAGVLVIAEADADLTDAMRQTLADRGVLLTESVLRPGAGFVDPTTLPVAALTSVRDAEGQLPVQYLATSALTPAEETSTDDDATPTNGLLGNLRMRTALREGADAEERTSAVYRLAAQTPCALWEIAVADIVGDHRMAPQQALRNETGDLVVLDNLVMSRRIKRFLRRVLR